MNSNDLIGQEIAAFEAHKAELLKHHASKFVVFHGGKLQGAFDTLDAAAKNALERFPPNTFLIREVGREPSMALPASLAFRPVHAAP